MALRTKKNTGRSMFSPEAASELAENMQNVDIVRANTGKTGDDSYQGAVTRALGSSGIQQLKNRAEVNERIKKINEDVEKLNERLEEKQIDRSQKEDRIKYLRDKMKSERGVVVRTFGKIGARVLLASFTLGCLILGIDGIRNEVTDSNRVRAEGVVIRQEVVKSIESGNEQVINAVNNITGNQILVTENGGQINVGGRSTATTNGTTTYTFYNVEQNAKWLVHNVYYDSYNGSKISNAEMHALNSATKRQFGPNTQNTQWENDTYNQMIIGFILGGVSLAILTGGAIEGNFSIDPIRRRKQQKKDMVEDAKDMASLDKQIVAVDVQMVAKNRELGALKEQLRELDGA